MKELGLVLRRKMVIGAEGRDGAVRGLSAKGRDGAVKELSG